MTRMSRVKLCLPRTRLKPTPLRLLSTSVTRPFSGHTTSELIHRFSLGLVHPHPPCIPSQPASTRSCSVEYPPMIQRCLTSPPAPSSGSPAGSSRTDLCCSSPPHSGSHCSYPPHLGSRSHTPQPRRPTSYNGVTSVYRFSPASRTLLIFFQHKGSAINADNGAIPNRWSHYLNCDCITGGWRKRTNHPLW